MGSWIYGYKGSQITFKGLCILCVGLRHDTCSNPIIQTQTLPQTIIHDEQTWCPCSSNRTHTRDVLVGPNHPPSSLLFSPSSPIDISTCTSISMSSSHQSTSFHLQSNIYNDTSLWSNSNLNCKLVHHICDHYNNRGLFCDPNIIANNKERCFRNPAVVNHNSSQTLKLLRYHNICTRTIASPSQVLNLIQSQNCSDYNCFYPLFAINITSETICNKPITATT
jgi:hypothetical protein